LDSVLNVMLIVFYPSFYLVLKNWNRKCFWTSVVYILWNGLYKIQGTVGLERRNFCNRRRDVI